MCILEVGTVAHTYSSNTSPSLARLRDRKEGKAGTSKQVEGTGGEINIKPDRALVDHSNTFLDCILGS